MRGYALTRLVSGAKGGAASFGADNVALYLKVEDQHKRFYGRLEPIVDIDGRYFTGNALGPL